jgi:hypothetical protein
LKGDVKVNATEIQRIIREHFENFMKVNWKIKKKWINF